MGNGPSGLPGNCEAGHHVSDTPIADLIERMHERDTPFDVILDAVRVLERVHVMSTGLSSGSRVESPDGALARRREYDREYKRKRRSEARLVSNSVSTGLSSGQVDISLMNGTSESQEVTTEVRKKETEGVNGRAKTVSRGTRLQRDAKLSDADRQFARSQGLTDALIDRHWAEFVDYWIGIPGQRGTKLDWPATWRNRVRQVAVRKTPQHQKSASPSPGVL